jgi:UDP-glucuronate 4-epimerase
VRFFTVYGPWGRPDMALFLFTKNIIDGLPINIYNNGNHQRDFTYVDDIVSGIILALFDDQFETNKSGALNTSDSFCKYRIMNIGRGRPVELMQFIDEIEKKLNKKAIKNFLPLQPGDVPSSNADISKMESIGYRPQYNFQKGISNFIDWYLEYYRN